jgi:hypothetical protein
MLFSEPTTALNSQSDLKTLLDVVAAMIIRMAECDVDLVAWMTSSILLEM